VSAGYYTKSSNLYVQNCSLGHTNGLRGLLSPDSDVDDLLARGKADNPPADDVESYDYGMRIIYRDRAGKYLRIFICVETYMDNPGDYTGFAELLKERIPKEHAGSHFAPKQSHITLESATHNVGKTLPSLTDVARWADAYGYLLVPKDGTQQG